MCDGRSTHRDCGGALRRYGTVWGGAALLFWLGGCLAGVRMPEAAPAPSSQASTRPSVWELPAGLEGRWVYERRDLVRRGRDDPEPYVRRISGGRIREGQLLNTVFLPIERYLRRPAMTPEQMEALPKAPLRARAALMVELDPPISLYPAQVSTTEPLVESAEVGLFDRRGHRIYLGRVEREIQTQGLEEVTCPAGTFRSCKRLRIGLRFRFPWGASADIDEYLWLDDAVGEVRRVERISVLYWVFWMEGAYEYRLVSYDPKPSAPAANRSGGPAEDGGAPILWSRAAAVFDRVFPHPRLSGLYAERVPPPAAEATPHALPETAPP